MREQVVLRKPFPQGSSEMVTEQSKKDHLKFHEIALNTHRGV